MIGRELGRGTGGRVYLAEDAVLARPVAIKFIAHLGAGARQQFLVEARTVAKIHHPNVVAVYRVGTYEQRPYLVTELVRGVSLAELAKPLPWPEALAIAIGVARGLAAVHRVNVVHCDLKPSNVVIDPEGVAKIIDFGLARAATEATTGGHAPIGTPDYVAPEVWRGESPSRRSDVYALGAVLFELIAGAPPFGDVASSALPARVTTGEAPALRDRAPDVDAALAAVVARCLRRDRLERYADGDEIREALERIHAARRPTVRAGENPYRGLLPFDAHHRGVFFGRRSEIGAVVERLRGAPIVLVTGDSGVGKSSLCRAGVLPAIVDGELGGAWQALTIVPGARPLTALANALGEPVAALREQPGELVRALRRRAGDGSLIVFIDQLEELITLGDPDEVAALDTALAALIDDAPGLRLLATVRADFLARLSTLPGLGRDLSRLLYFLRPLPPERLRDVIVEPAQAMGVRFESSAIVDELIAATAEAGGGGLPLLSFALADLWEARQGEVIPERAVAAMGGVVGALSRHADVVIGGMVASERTQARRLLLRLVSGMGTRARRAAGELALDDTSRGALDALVRGRLVVVHEGDGEPVYELAHEYMLTGWPKLRQWLDEDTAGRATRERLAGAAAEWLRLGRPNDATWRGLRLVEALALDAATLSPSERAFVAASRHAYRWRRWQRGLIAVGAIALVVGAFATQRLLARRELQQAVTAELVVAHELFAIGRAHELRAEYLARELLPHYDGTIDLDRFRAGNQAWRPVIAQRDEADQAYRRATGVLEGAFAKDPTRRDIRHLLADVLLQRADLADRLYDARTREEMLERMALFDDDRTRRARWGRASAITIEAPPHTALELVDGDGKRERIGTGTVRLSRPAGSYTILAHFAGTDVRAPIRVERDTPLTVPIAAPPARIPAGFVYVPEGDFLYGNPNEEDRQVFFIAPPIHRVHTPAFLIARHEVTFGDWVEFLDALPRDERAHRLPGGGIQLQPDGASHWKIAFEINGQIYAAGWGKPIRYKGRNRRETQDWRKMPVLGISVDDARAYADWLARTARVPRARLCNEVEWERAARGADARGYPAIKPPEGDDANIDGTYGFELQGPDEVGSHPASQSPFGIDDMIGNALEWTQTEARESYLLRGGSYHHDFKTGHLTNRSPMPASTRDPSIGVRICASI